MMCVPCGGVCCGPTCIISCGGVSPHEGKLLSGGGGKTPPRHLNRPDVVRKSPVLHTATVERHTKRKTGFFWAPWAPPHFLGGNTNAQRALSGVINKGVYTPHRVLCLWAKQQNRGFIPEGCNPPFSRARGYSKWGAQTREGIPLCGAQIFPKPGMLCNPFPYPLTGDNFAAS